MSKILFIGSILLSVVMVMSALFGDKVVSSTSKKIGQEQSSRSCDKGPGFCLECGLSMSGTFDCHRPKVNCTGRQKALFDLYEVSRLHESGKHSTITERRFVRPLGKCL